MVKTIRGWVNKQTLGDGRETEKNWVKRQIGIIKPTKTKLKRRKKAEAQLIEMIEKY